MKRFHRDGGQIVIYTDSKICESKRELLNSRAFEDLVKLFVGQLAQQGAFLLTALDIDAQTTDNRSIRRLINMLRALCEHSLEQVAAILPEAAFFLQTERRDALQEFVERLYDYWRSFDRYMVLLVEPGASSFEQRPYRAFNETLVTLARQVRALYRDLGENITAIHPRIYRQVAAGCNAGLIAVPKQSSFPKEYVKIFGQIPYIRQVWFAPPFIIDPPMASKSDFLWSNEPNPVSELKLDASEWLCYPAQVGHLVIFVYLHRQSIGFGCALANLLELANDEQITAGPDALCLFDLGPENTNDFFSSKTLFFDDKKNDLLMAVAMRHKRFGCFDGLQQMILTLHDAVMIKCGRVPFYGALGRVLLKSGQPVHILLVGGTSSGKIEILEALRTLDTVSVVKMRVVAHSSGSLTITDDNKIMGFGTGVGAFVRLTGLRQECVLEQTDRAIIMSPQKKNGSMVLPVTTMDEVLRGCPIDLLLYINNYKEIDGELPVIEQLNLTSDLIEVLWSDESMTADAVLPAVDNVGFVNKILPLSYRKKHEKLAAAIFDVAYKTGVFIGQVRIGCPAAGCEVGNLQDVAKMVGNIIDNKVAQ